MFSLHVLLLISGFVLISAYYILLSRRTALGRTHLALLAAGCAALFAHAFIWRDVVMCLAGLAVFGLGLRLWWTAATRREALFEDKDEDADKG